ncbi:MAG: TetR/AcrR family transcriptional regulator [Deltaproteobacteria bacterium]|nr:TetR/AcrR family transcriptional regulator [Deltaproteobacteria bacterium]MBT8465187.1 TetR/AcrR family transcriptional regulator [Deltaproteobacteria bacterium]MBT8483027.1 TetR/AcrR family transcriptional regulator [Deltaproteobacteria bacterium]
MANKPTDQLTPRRRPSQERSRDRVERILDATSSLLGDTPVDKITTAAIAEQAGVPIGSVYQYFPNKLAILAELARRVMEEVDLKTASLIAEDFGVLPWDRAIDRAIDATIEGFASQPGYLQLLLSIRPTPEFRAITDESNERVAAMLAFHPALQRLIPANRIQLVTRAAIEAANALQDWALSEDDPALRNQIIVEMKTLLKGYLAVYMDESSPYRRESP